MKPVCQFCRKPVRMALFLIHRKMRHAVEYAAEVAKFPEDLTRHAGRKK